ncbi:vWA domain-containing protein [Piscibacillus halophilus]|uniref:D-amino-acid dehydrogenase/Ca-activated chloride channel family protein n=1 Tax=Piscibacillus halophilus TaxID=571933 RepID=A0A1H9CBT7_9BACI|nr:VWA domain-containing protein [Piscibacillus halophilus]SEP98253.1 D-amino-acid dehydrogenase/Ca-activated chloride channel family protein [Piscibacillus halophilus]
MLRFKWVLSMIFLLVLLMTACSNQNTASDENDENEGESEFNEFPEAATDPEGMIEEGPGELFSMDEIDEEALKNRLEALPEDSTADDVYRYLTSLFAADFQPPLSKYEKFDPSFSVEGAPESENFEEENETEEKKQHIALLMDASGSMGASVGNETKMEAAKNALKQFVSDLPEDAQIMLRVYGHKGSNKNADKERSCESSEVVYPLDIYDSEKFEEALSLFEPVGWTPLAASIEAAEEDLMEHSGDDVENVVYVISDGEETCDGDPVKAAKELHESGIATAVNIIGFDVGNEAQKQLQEVANAGGGEFTNVDSGAELLEAAQNSIGKALQDASNNIWGALEKTDINWDKIDKNNELNSISSEFQDIIKRESRLYDRGINLLVEQEQINEEVVSDLEKLIEDRYNELSQYNEEQFDQYQGLMEEEYEKTINMLDELGRK